uniref:Uncharacterized protein n=1 Tax=Vannella robusta TaxID=1487602 RepID=A0A7S4MG95_9EUKA|mmetsp:Transcript_21280/g.27006  ORF Transcript_21280/g.27006 Transcript_21280/m.27006 type:complete len:269 (+) Transcript_21280:180-986(+)
MWTVLLNKKFRLNLHKMATFCVRAIGEDELVTFFRERRGDTPTNGKIELILHKEAFNQFFSKKTNARSKTKKRNGLLNRCSCQRTSDPTAEFQRLVFYAKAWNKFVNSPMFNVHCTDNMNVNETNGDKDALDQTMPANAQQSCEEMTENDENNPTLDTNGSFNSILEIDCVQTHRMLAWNAPSPSPHLKVSASRGINQVDYTQNPNTASDTPFQHFHELQAVSPDSNGKSSQGTRTIPTTPPQGSSDLSDLGEFIQWNIESGRYKVDQ